MSLAASALAPSLSARRRRAGQRAELLIPRRGSRVYTEAGSSDIRGEGLKARQECEEPDEDFGLQEIHEHP